MGQIAVHAVFYAFISTEFESAAALNTEWIQRTKTEQAVELIFCRPCVTGKVFAFFITKKPVRILHIISALFLLFHKLTLLIQ